MTTASIQRDHLKELIDRLPESTLTEVSDFIEFLAEKERKRKAFAERTLEIERASEPLEFESVKEAMKAIRNWSE
jgi:hypothetical protein